MMRCSKKLAVLRSKNGRLGKPRRPLFSRRHRRRLLSDIANPLDSIAVPPFDESQVEIGRVHDFGRVILQALAGAGILHLVHVKAAETEEALFAVSGPMLPRHAVEAGRLELLLHAAQGFGEDGVEEGRGGVAQPHPLLLVLLELDDVVAKFHGQRLVRPFEVVIGDALACEGIKMYKKLSKIPVTFF